MSEIIKENIEEENNEIIEEDKENLEVEETSKTEDEGSEETLNEEEPVEEEIPQEKTSLLKKLKDPKYTKHKVALILLLMTVVVSLGYYVYQSMNWTAEKICRSLVSNVDTLELVVMEENSDPSISYFKDSLLKDVDAEYTGMIEVFENKTEALLKKEYYELYDKKMSEYFNDTNLGAELGKTYSTGSWTIYVNGNTLIRLSYHYSDYQIKQLTKQFNAVMEKTYQTEKNIPTEDQQKTIQSNYKKQVDSDVKAAKDEFISSIEATLTTLKAEANQEDTTIDRLLEIKEEASAYKNVLDLSAQALEVEDAVNQRIQSQIDEIDGILDEAENNYSRDKVQEAKDAIALLTHEVFDEYKDPWTKRIEQILYKIKEKEIQDYKNQCVEYSYYEIDQSYDGKYAYFYGKIMSISTNSSGRIALVVNVTPQYLFGSIAYWSNSVYVDMDSDISAFYEQGDLIEMWGTLEGVVTNEQVFGDAKTYPSFYCKYASK